MIQPTKGRLLVKKLKIKDVETDAGVFIPGTEIEEEELLQGEVVIHNPGPRVEREFTPGEKVYFSKYSSQRVYDEDRKDFLHLVSDLDVQAVKKIKIT